MSRTRRSVITAIALAGATILGVTSVHALEAGDRAPEIGLRDLNGREVNLAALRGRVVLVNFWASWCEPCGEEMPILEQMYQRHRERGFLIVGVSQDRTADNMRTFLGRHRVSFPIVHDGSHAVAGRYTPPRMPSSFLFDRAGVVRYVHAGYRAGDGPRIEQQVTRLLGQSR